MQPHHLAEVCALRLLLVSHVSMPTATTVTTWDMYDTLMSPEEETVCSPERAERPEAKVERSRGAEGSVSVGSTVSTGNSEGCCFTLAFTAHFTPCQR